MRHDAIRYVGLQGLSAFCRIVYKGVVRCLKGACPAAVSLGQNPSNEYLNIHADPSWEALELIWNKVPAEHTKVRIESAWRGTDEVSPLSYAPVTIIG